MISVKIAVSSYHAMAGNKETYRIWTTAESTAREALGLVVTDNDCLDFKNFRLSGIRINRSGSFRKVKDFKHAVIRFVHI